MLPCSFSAAHKAFPQNIQRWCQKGQSKNSGSLSWSDKLSLSYPQYRPAENTLLEGSPRSSPALCHYSLRESEKQRGAEIYSEIGEEEGGINSIRASFQSVSVLCVLGRSALTLQEGLQVLDVLCVLERVRFVECDIQWVGTNHQPCNDNIK